MFLEGQEKNILPKGGQTPDWLIKNFGTEMAAKLVDAFVHFPCFYCQKRLQPCENCKGAGHHNFERICDPCLGLGVVKCNFCAGTGWVAIDYVPVGLRPAVIKRRSQLASRRINAILSHPLFQSSPETSNTTFKEYTQSFLDLNKQISVLENSLEAGRDLSENNPQSKTLINKMVGTCVKSGLKGWKGIHEILQSMASAARLEVQDDTNDTQNLAGLRADYYQSLYDSYDEFIGTNGEHPFLWKAAKELWDKKKRKARS
jgi:hypothetical protein